MSESLPTVTKQREGKLFFKSVTQASFSLSRDGPAASNINRHAHRRVHTEPH